MDARNRRGFIAAVSIASGLALAPAALADGGGGDQQDTRRNTAAVRRAFARQNSGGSFYEILADDVVWTIVNGRTYHGKEQFLDEGAAPVLTRLRTSLHMTPLRLWADRDTVVAMFDADAVALDGVAYHNNYCWIMRFRGSRVVEVFAFLDLVAVNELVARVGRPS
ncbi:nuclear transport factor 2 family protein [Umezawaea beigongshangensis]|uniref:nuclear transport factor 2 family protein n=1 Tax=Umezawaea beigongshangensis TaxID=2780383 RepID=UPI0018F201E7|nr:nuclear transport factor 2 family protein [Umezawaea beigongshangensis]